MSAPTEELVTKALQGSLENWALLVNLVRMVNEVRKDHQVIPDQ
jgi:hypothetical protein